MAKHRKGAPEETEPSAVVKRLINHKPRDEPAVTASLGAAAALLWTALPPAARRREDFMHQPPEAFAPTRQQLHEMLDLALVLQSGAATGQELMVWRLLGGIILRQAFGGLRDTALWMARGGEKPAPERKARRAAIALLRDTPNLFPPALNKELRDALTALERGDRATPALLRKTPFGVRKATRDEATFWIVLLIEFFVACGMKEELLLAEAYEATGTEAGTIERWRENYTKSENEDLPAGDTLTWTQRRRRLKASLAPLFPGRGPFSMELVREQFTTAAQAWKEAGGKAKGSRSAQPHPPRRTPAKA